MKKGIPIIILLVILYACGSTALPLCDATDRDRSYPVIAHSHNDYEQTTPIFTALEHGFTSLEVDIVYDGTDLKVSHDLEDLPAKSTFEASYLAPLLKVKDFGPSGLLLLVDIKNYSDELLHHLNLVLNKYGDQLVSRAAPDDVAQKIKVVLSGDIPRADILAEASNQYLFIDGRLTEHDLHASSALVPLISMNFTKIPTLDGAVYNGENEPERVAHTIELVHRSGKIIRFWNTKDQESTWLSLLALKVDVIGVDDITLFCRVMKKNKLME